MLVGATGTGKSTFVDGIINYLLGVTWEDPFRYTIIDLEAEEKGRIQNQAVSQTEWITCYTINPEEGSRLSYQLHIIDTPGFGDTRGLKRDQEIVGQIRQLFSDTGPKGVSCINAVCFLIKAPDARLTAIQSYIFQSIMSLFGKDIEKNICSLITFADGSDPPVLAALKESEMPFGKNFTFNNSALFATNSGMENQSLSPMFWNIGLASFCAFFNHLGQMIPQSLQLTKDVLLERYRLEAIVNAMKDNLDAGLQMVEVLKSEKNVLQQHKTAMEANKNYEVEVTEPIEIKTLIPGRVHNTKCDNCYVKCHPHCVFEDNEEKRFCWAMDGNGKCRICPDKCEWTAHKNDAFTHTHGTRKVMKTLNELKDKYNDASGKAKSHEEMVAKNAARLQELTNNIEDMMLLVKFCNDKLQDIALKTNPLTMTEHIDLMIENEKLTKREGYIKRIEVLNEFRKDAEVHKEVEVFKRVADVELGETCSEKKKEKRPMDSKSVLQRVAKWFLKHIPGYSI
ncbi:uncharacterized protein LOC132754913 [Ruditapes philippinarum]|uniref:uncharacterized protein LOC132754913 n=1 Tax=Ruditapes philippinarum TaxID=129788 RepID=UPI00295AE5B1|nr:uncharacterized protein LOC132754913 [Ruditapes philippinarum]